MLCFKTRKKRDKDKCMEPKWSKYNLKCKNKTKKKTKTNLNN